MSDDGHDEGKDGFLYDAQGDDVYETASDEIERALRDCGQTGVPGFCWHAGTEFCSYHCRFRHAPKRQERNAHG